VDALRERFGKYHVLAKLAQGGMAEIYKVKTVGIAGFEKVQALKRILPSSAREPRFIRSFIDEARIAVELTHRNIVQVFDFGKADGELFMAMELIEGRDLRTAVAQAVATDRMCPVPVAAYIVAEIAAGLDYAHRKTDGYGGALGIVHCDVSPSNVMLSNDGDVKILDFGIARASFASAMERKRLRGKPRYMAPEQTYGEPPTAASDVFAVAIIAWELLTGLPLYRGHDLKSILRAVRKSEPPRVDAMNASVPTGLCDAVARALARDPAERGGAGELATACVRAALTVGARDLAAWLRDIDAPPPRRAPTPTPVAVELQIGEGTPDDDDEVILLVPKRKPIVAVPIAPIDDAADAPQPATADGDDADAAATAVSAPAMTDAAALAELSEPGIILDALAEPPPPPSPAVVADVDWTLEPIDDDLGDVEPAAQVERRRAVIVATTIDLRTAPEGAIDGAARSLAGSLGELAYQRGGVVVADGPDDLVVAFGLEVAGEDDVAVAVAWSLDAAAIARDAGAALRIGARAGVATTMEAGAPRVPGDAIDDARALARDATPDRPVLTGATGRLTGRLYALRDVAAPRRLGRRGKVVEVIGARPFEERDRARLERKGALIGRDAQLRALDAEFAAAVAGARRRAVVIAGAAGTGKSRLVAELVARHDGARVVIAAATPASRLAPFALLGDVYQAALGFPPVRGRAARARLVERVHHQMASSGLAATRARAIAADLDRAMELRDGASLAAAEIADLRPRVSAGLAAFRAAAADPARPLITVVEDLHLADAPSLDVLRHLLAVPAAGAELLVATVRPGGVSFAPVGDAVVEVGDLAGTELRALVADRLGDAATDAAIDAVIARAGGNPLFIEELAQAVREAGGRGGDVPATARDVALARADRLDARAKAALRFAAVLGADIRIRLLEELVDGGDLAAALDELGEAGMLARGDADAVTFPRGLVREVVYEAMPGRARRDAHRRVGRLLASRFFAGREEVPAVIAEHLEKGGEPAASAAFWLRAGRAALGAGDGAAARTCFERCLILENELGEEPRTRASRARRAGATAGAAAATRMSGLGG
jgi:serine/threonine protein kinase